MDQYPDFEEVFEQFCKDNVHEFPYTSLEEFIAIASLTVNCYRTYHRNRAEFCYKKATAPGKSR